MNPYRRSLSLAVVALIIFGGCSDVVVAPSIDVGDDPDDLVIASEEMSFPVAAAAVVDAETFTGKVVWRPGPAGEVRVTVVRRASHAADFARLPVETVADRQGVSITAGNPDGLKRAQVDLVIAAPADARPRLRSGVGSVDYQGRPRGSCSFSAGVGSILMAIPADAGVVVELSAAVGRVYVDLAVDGTVRSDYVAGTIGAGDEGVVRASTAVGDVRLVRR